MTKSQLRLVSPYAVIGTVPPSRKPNAELRTREYLTEPEVERLIKAAKANRHGQRDATMILLAFRHGLRAADRGRRGEPAGVVMKRERERVSKRAICP